MRGYNLSLSCDVSVLLLGTSLVFTPEISGWRSKAAQALSERPNAIGVHSWLLREAGLVMRRVTSIWKAVRGKQ